MGVHDYNQQDFITHLAHGDMQNARRLHAHLVGTPQLLNNYKI